MAELTFYGAVEGVTGSAYFLSTDSAGILLECGLFQGRREEEAANARSLPCKVSDLDAVVLSHAHLDHSGRLPKIVQDGFNRPIFMTYPTYDLLEVLLKDAAVLTRGSRQSLHSFLPVLRYSTSSDDSMAINKITSGAIIIAGSGMCNGGRIRHHLKHNL